MRCAVLTEASDGDLLDQFCLGDEAAFSVLVARHGAMVHGVCRRVLKDPSSADDAVQATFLALAARGSALARRLSGHEASSLGPWLNRVAYRAALQIRRSESARTQRQEAVARSPIASPTPGDPGESILDILDEELQKLPDVLREPMVLHYLEEHSQQEAADLLNLSYATLRRRLERGRDLLRQRLERRGVVVSSLLLLDVLGKAAPSYPIRALGFDPFVASRLPRTRPLKPGSLPGASDLALSTGLGLARDLGLERLAKRLGLAVPLALLLLAVVLGTRSPAPVIQAGSAAPLPAPPQPAAVTAPPNRALATETPGRGVPSAETPQLAVPPTLTGPVQPPHREPPPEPPPIDAIADEGVKETFFGEININGKVSTFTSAADFDRASREMTTDLNGVFPDRGVPRWMAPGAFGFEMGPETSMVEPTEPPWRATRPGRRRPRTLRRPTSELRDLNPTRSATSISASISQTLSRPATGGCPGGVCPPRAASPATKSAASRTTPR